MELRHMRYFVAVAEHLHFGRAAEALMTAQPSLSRQIQQLEEELGVKLFERNNRNVELTAAGRIFLADARRTLDAADAGMRHARENAEGTRGQLRLGFIAGAMMTHLPLVLREHRQRFPDVDIVAHTMSIPEMQAALHTGTIDLAWTIPPPDPDITSAIITADSLVAAVPAGHRLAKRKLIAIGDLAGEALIVLSRSVTPMLHDDTIAMCLANGFRPSRIYEVLEGLTLLGFVAAGYGVSLAPFPWSVLQLPGVAFRKLSVDFAYNETLSWRSDRYTPIVRTFVETARLVLGSE
jgi:DNA-binding transcriptional LysR family regulator